MNSITRIVIDCETNQGAIEGNLTDVWCIGVYFPVNNSGIIYHNVPDDLAKIQKLLDDPVTYSIFHNASFDCWVLEKLGLIIDYSRVHDTMLMSYSYLPGSSHSLSALCEQFHTNVKKYEYEDQTFDGYTTEMGEYCINDCRATWELYKRLSELVKQHCLEI